MATPEVRFLDQHEFTAWDAFVDASPQGTLACKSFWLETVCHEFRIVACTIGEKIIAGMPLEERKIGPFKIAVNPELTQFMGVLFQDNNSMNPRKRDSKEKKLLQLLLAFIEPDYARVAINNNYHLQDVRPFRWRNYRIIVRYSYVLEINEPEQLLASFETRVRTDIKKGERSGLKVVSTDDTAGFHELHELTYTRQGKHCPVSYAQTDHLYKRLKEINRAALFFCKDVEGTVHSAMFMVWDDKQAYYLMGANHPDLRNAGSGNLIMHRAIEKLGKIGIKTLDLYGANTDHIAFYKRGFGGALKTYYRAVKYNSRFLEIADIARRLIFQRNNDF